MNMVKIVSKRLLVKSGLRPAYTWWRHRGLIDEDVMLAGYQRSGSTWLQNLVYEMLTGTTGDPMTIKLALPYIGHHRRQTRRLLSGTGRIIKTHEPFYDRYYKAVYLVRDPRDVILSDYKYLTMYGLYTRSFDQYVGDFLAGRAHGTGSWERNVTSWMAARKAGKIPILWISFEDLKSDTGMILGETADFLGVEIDPTRVDEIISHNTVDEMRKREDAAPANPQKVRRDLRVVNEGRTGGWRESMATEHQERLTHQLGALMTELGYDLETTGTGTNGTV